MIAFVLILEAGDRLHGIRRELRLTCFYLRRHCLSGRIANVQLWYEYMYQKLPLWNVCLLFTPESLCEMWKFSHIRMWQKSKHTNVLELFFVLNLIVARNLISTCIPVRALHQSRSHITVLFMTPRGIWVNGKFVRLAAYFEWNAFTESRSAQQIEEFRFRTRQIYSCEIF